MKFKALGAAVFLAFAIAFPAAAQHGGGHGKPSPAPGAPVGPDPAAVLLDGKPFPPVRSHFLKLPQPRRVLFVAAGKPGGDGSEQHPWNDLRAALCALGPGDRLRVAAGSYPGGLRVDGPCQDGQPAAPIQVVFDGKATIGPGEGASAVTLRRANWILVGLHLELDDSPEAGVLVEGSGADHVMLEGVRIADGSGPGVRIDHGAREVTVSNARIARKPAGNPPPSAFGIQIGAGTTGVRLIRNHLNGNPAGSIRVDAPDSGTHPAERLFFQGNTIRDGSAAAISVAAADGLKIEDNTLSAIPGPADGRAIVLERARDVSIHRNVVSGFAVGIQVGRASPDDPGFAAPESVTVGRNYLESARPGAAGLDIEAGDRVRFLNNVVAGGSPAILVFGAPPQTKAVTIANNLLLAVGETAFAVADPQAVALFDFNIFSAKSGAPEIQFGAQTMALDRFLKEGTMPHSRLARVEIVQRDLARVSGADVVDRGTAVPGTESKGSAPDIGVAEK